MEIKLRTTNNDDRARLLDILEYLRAPPSGAGLDERIDAALGLSEFPWEIREYKRLWPEPILVPTEDITLRDLHALCQDLIYKQGAAMLIKLYEVYGITDLTQLPLGRIADFYSDVYTAYYSVRAKFPDEVEA